MEKFNKSAPSFYALGISYKKADASIRGKFSLDARAHEALLKQAAAEGIESLLVISTCNRTELYGTANHPYELIRLLCENSSGSVEEFRSAAFVYKNEQAATHLFRVAAGLESQILGDFEILGQIKNSFNLSRQHGLSDTFMDRLVNAVIKAGKKIRTETGISSGAASVSFAAVQYIIRNAATGSKNILLFGTGKIGRNTCENLVKHTPNSCITLINRTNSSAEILGEKLSVTVKDYADLTQEIQHADILVVATGARIPTIDKTQLGLHKPLLILDLSIPRNVNTNVLEIPGVSLLHLDELSVMRDDTLQRRQQHIPAAEAVIEDLKSEFYNWLNERKYAPAIQALKAKLTDIAAAEMALQKKKAIDFDTTMADAVSARIVQKITSHFAHHLKNENCSIEQSIEFMEKVFQIGKYNKTPSVAEIKYNIKLS